MISGCGVPKGNVSGKVTYQGKPLPSGTIVFLGPDDRPVNSSIGGDGSYQVQGVTVGTARITVETPWEFAKAQRKNAPKLPPDAPPMANSMMIQAIEIPKKYGDPQQSGVTYDVQKGAQVHDIDLE
jgi:hypothetical protein